MQQRGTHLRSMAPARCTDLSIPLRAPSLLRRGYRVCAIILIALIALVAAGCASQPASSSAVATASCQLRIDPDLRWAWQHGYASPEDEDADTDASGDTDDGAETPDPADVDDATADAIHFNWALGQRHLLQAQVDGRCVRLLDGQGHPLAITAPADVSLAKATQLSEADGSELWRLQFNPDSPAPSPATGPTGQYVQRLVRVDAHTTRISPELRSDIGPTDGWPNLLYEVIRDEESDYPPPTHTAPTFPAAGKPDLAQDLAGHYGLIDPGRLEYVIPPVYDEIRGYVFGQDTLAPPAFWAAAKRPQQPGAPAQIELFDPDGHRMQQTLQIGYVEPRYLSDLVILRVRDKRLPPVTIPASAASGRPTTAFYGDLPRRAAAGNACLYLDAQGRRIEASPALPDASGYCPIPVSGLLRLTLPGGHLALYRIVRGSPPQRLPISDVPGRLVTTRVTEVDGKTLSLAIVVRGDSGAQRFSVYDFDGKRLIDEDFDQFTDLGCGFWRVHDATKNQWLSIKADGSLDTELYYPFSC